MTCIAWDGKTMAADKQATASGQRRTVTKLFRIDWRIVAVSGDLDKGVEMVEWLRIGSPADKFPHFQRTDDFVSVMVLESIDKCLRYEQTPIPFVVEDKQWAIGSGRDYAIAAMHLGRTAAEAVAVACLFDVSCGMGIDTMEPA